MAKFPSIDEIKNWPIKKKVILVVTIIVICSTPLLGVVMGLAYIAFWVVLIGQGFKDRAEARDKKHKERLDILNPRWRKYNSSCQIVFSKIRQILKETTYGYGDKWNVITADVQSNKIIADLKLTGGTSIDGPKKKSHLRMTAQIHTDDQGATTLLKVVFDENSETEDQEYDNCSVAAHLMRLIDKSIGGVQIGNK